MSFGLGVRDPIARADNVQRLAANKLEVDYYGESYQKVKRGIEKAQMEGNTQMEGIFNAQLQHRLSDHFYGRLSSLKNVKTKRGGRGSYYDSVVSGRGMYMQGAVGRGAYKRRKGRGSYKDVRRGVAKAARFGSRNFDTLSSIGGSLAMATGNPGVAAAGAALAPAMRQSLGLIGGRGAYNTLFPNQGPTPIEFESSAIEHGNMVVTGSEKVSDVYGNSLRLQNNVAGTVELGEDGVTPTGRVQPFEAFAIDLYPGNFAQFPKLSQHAANFKEYEFVQLIFVYKSTLAPNWTTESVTTGKVVIATQMDVNRPAWQTFDEMSSIETKTEGLITGTHEADRVHTHGVECDPRMLTTKGLKFVRTKGLTGDMTRADYDQGITYFGVQGTGPELADKMIGEVWVQYKVAFKTHRTYTGLGQNIPNTIKYNDFHNNARIHMGTGGVGKLDALFDFNSATTINCDYNNIQFKSTVTDLIGHHTQIPPLSGSTPYSFRYAYGKKLKLTFPSSLRGDYEIKLDIYGHDLAGDEQAQDESSDKSLSSAMWDASEFYPVLTGTAELNFDIVKPVYDVGTEHSTNRSSRINIKQEPMQLDMNRAGMHMKYHIHLGQAISQEDNSVELIIPIFWTSDPGETSLSNAMQHESQGPYIDFTKLEITQYNAQQRLLKAGFPYTTLAGVHVAP